MAEKVLIIGANTLVGRRLKSLNLPDECVYSSRTPKDEAEVALDLEKLSSFTPNFTPRWVVVTVPIWYLSFEALHHFYDLGCERVIAISSTSRFTKTDSGDDAEQRIAEKLKAGEERLMAFCAQNDMSYTILRPTLIYDEGRDENISRIAEFIEKWGFFPVCGFAQGLRQPVHASDLAHAVLDVLRSLSTKNRSYNLSGADTIPYAEMVNRIFEALEKPIRVIYIPAFVWWLYFKAMDLIRPQDPLKLNYQMAKRMTEDLVFDHKRARDDFGYAPKGFLPRFPRALPDKVDSTFRTRSA